MYQFTRRTFLKILSGFAAVLGMGLPRSGWARSATSNAGALAEMEKKIAALEKEAKLARDIQAIRELQYRYVDGTFFGKWEDVTDCFAEKTINEDGKVISKEEMGKRLKAIGTSGNIDRQGGYTVHPVIEVSDDKARGRCLLYMLMSYHLTQQLMFYLQKIYDVEYIREDGKWKIYNMKLTHMQGPVPADGGYSYPGT